MVPAALDSVIEEMELSGVAEITRFGETDIGLAFGFAPRRSNDRTRSTTSPSVPATLKKHRRFGPGPVLLLLSSEASWAIT